MLKIPDILQLNDWEPKKFLRTMVAIHLAMLGAIGLDFIGLEIPILRQVVGFVYLTFVPGIVILRLLKLHKLGVTVTVILSAGLSISFLMFSGFFLNTILSILKIGSPLSSRHVLVFITGLVTLLTIQSYKTNKFQLDEPSHFKISRSASYLLLFPVLSILGTYLVNFKNNNIVLMILIVLIALIPLLIALKRIPSDLYPLSLFVISLSLLFSNSLISMYLTGFDIHQEYYYHTLVVNGAFWNSENWGNINGMLSIVILPAIYSYFLKMDGAWVFKIVYPIIFSLVPLGLYCVYQRQIKNEKIAFFSVFFFMSFFTYFTEMLSLARQEIAELFFVLLIFLMVDDALNKNICNLLLLIFGASLVTSHYGLSYIYMALIIIIFLFSLINASKIREGIFPEFNLKKSTLYYFVGFYIVFLLIWYINVSSSSAFQSIVDIGDHIYTSIFTDFFKPGKIDRSILMAVGAADPVVPSLGKNVHRDLQIITQIFIVLGFLKIIVNREFTKLKAEYFYLVFGSFALLLLSLLPNFSASLNMTRIYHIILIAISPLFFVGGILLVKILMQIVKKEIKQDHMVLFLILCVLIPYFLFNTGFIYEMTNDVPFSFSLGMERMKNDNIAKFDLYSTYTPEQDVFSAIWFSENKDANKRIYSDTDSSTFVLYSYGMTPRIDNTLFIGNKLLPWYGQLSNYYTYLRKFNVCENTFVISSKYKVNTSVLSPFTSKSTRIYSNGCGEIYAKER